MGFTAIYNNEITDSLATEYQTPVKYSGISVSTVGQLEDLGYTVLPGTATCITTGVNSINGVIFVDTVGNGGSLAIAQTIRPGMTMKLGTGTTSQEVVKIRAVDSFTGTTSWTINVTFTKPTQFAHATPATDGAINTSTGMDFFPAMVTSTSTLLGLTAANVASITFTSAQKFPSLMPGAQFCILDVTTGVSEVVVMGAVTTPPQYSNLSGLYSYALPLDRPTTGAYTGSDTISIFPVYTAKMAFINSTKTLVTSPPQSDAWYKITVATGDFTTAVN